MFETREPNNHPNSYYLASAIDMPSFPMLDGSATCDVCIIGAGFTGLSAAIHLAERGYNVVVLEGRRVGWGASGRNGGQIGTGQHRDQGDLEDEVGKENARNLWYMFKEARSLIRDQVSKHDIECDLQTGGLSVAYKQRDVDWFQRYAEKLHRDYDTSEIHTVSKNEINQMLGSQRFHGGLLDTDAGHLHPLNYALGLARAARDAGVRIYENSLVRAYDNSAPVTVRTQSGNVTANFLVLACNGYLGKLEPQIASKIMPINNYVLATEPLGEDVARSLIRDNVCVADTKFVVDYWRTSNDHRLVFGGGESYSPNFPSDIKNFVRKYMLRVYPQLSDVKIDYAWGGTLGITMTRMPHLGRLTPSVYFAHGYSGHGVALTGLAGKLIAEAIAGQAERFDVFAQLRAPTFPGGTLLRWPGLVLGMLYYNLRDKL